MDRVELIKQICKGKKVLDVGCAGGGRMIRLHRAIREVASYSVGIDNDANSVTKLPQEYNVLVGDAENFHFSIKFDVIVAGELIEHLHNPGKFLECARDNLNDDGKLVLTTPNLYSAYLLKRNFLDGRPYEDDSMDHVLGFTPSILRNLLQRNNWEIEELKLVPLESAPSSLKGKVLTKLFVLSFLQRIIFCVARKK